MPTKQMPEIHDVELELTLSVRITKGSIPERIANAHFGVESKFTKTVAAILSPTHSVVGLMNLLER